MVNMVEHKNHERDHVHGKVHIFYEKYVLTIKHPRFFQVEMLAHLEG